MHNQRPLHTLCLLDAVPEMRLCADLSHFVVDREFKLPLAERDAILIQRIIERSDSFQGRVASRQQIQLQLDFPQHQKWVELFKQWWRDSLVSCPFAMRMAIAFSYVSLGPQNMR